MNLDLHKLSLDTYTLVFLLLSCIGGGVIFICIYFNSFFTAIDNYRLTAFAIGIVSPLWLINTIYAGVRDGIRIQLKLKQIDKRKAINHIIDGLFYTIPIIHISNVLGYYLKLENKTGITLVIITEIVLPVILFIEIILSYRKYQRNKLKQEYH